MDEIPVSPGTFVCPENFSVVNTVDGLCYEDLENDDTELWLIQSPLDMDPSDLNKQKISLNGTSELRCSSEDIKYECTALNCLPEEMGQFHLIIPKKSDGTLCAATKPFKGHIQITEKIDLPELCEPVKARKWEKVNLSDLKQRYVPFGSDEPFCAAVTSESNVKVKSERHRKKRKKGHKSSKHEHKQI